MASKDLYIEGANVTKVVKALSSDVRIKILNLLADTDMNIQTMANRLGISKTNALTHINILEESGFVKSQYISGSVGNQRICRKIYDRLIFTFDPSITNDDGVYYEKEISVGNYFNFEAYAPCGIANNHRILKKWDDPSALCEPERVMASVVWTAFGYLEYKIPIDPMFAGKTITAVEIIMEISAHTLISNHKDVVYPSYMTRDRVTEGISDVTFWINDIELGTQTIFAGVDIEKAIFTPTWWRTTPNHGELVKVLINEKGCFIGDKKVSDVKYNNVIQNESFFSLKVGIKEDATNSSGIMIFGKNFGRYYQDLIIKTFIA